MDYKNLRPALLNEKDVTTDWVEEMLPEYGTGSASYVDENGCHRTLFFRYGVAWEAAWLSNDSAVDISPQCDFTRRINRDYFDSKLEQFKESIEFDFNDVDYINKDIKVVVEIVNKHIVISFWWDMNKINK